MNAQKPLRGIRVLDASRLLPGPFASMILADLGAQVDKLEDTHGGDYLRVTPPLCDDGMSSIFHLVNRGKRSMTLDLKKPEGRDAFIELVKHYDVLLESNRPGVMDRLGLSFETLLAANPKLVQAAITGYGQTGPDKDAAGHDLNYLARAGVLGFTGPADRAPQVHAVQMADISGGLYCVIGVLAALRDVSQGGKGTFVDISMVESSLTLATVCYGAYQGGVRVPRGEEVLTGGIAPYNTYLTKDGGAVSIGALEPKFWMAFCKEVGIDDGLAALMPGPHQAKWKADLTALFVSRTRDEWTALGKRVDCCLEPVLTAEESMNEQQIAARDVWVKRVTHTGSEIRIPRTPVATPAEGLAPKQGEHSEAILREAGFDSETVTKLRGLGVIR
jgi:alpha-methylacyl-CoA racemase